MNRAKKFSVGTLVMLFFCFGFVLKAQADCGEIVTPAGFYSPEDLEERLLIENCANPFGETEFNNYSVIPSFGDIPIVEGDDLIVDTLPVTLSYDEKWSGISSTTQLYTAIYQQVDSNYYLIPSLAEEVTFHATGTYVLVINAYELFLTENTKWWHNSFTDLFMPSVAYAEEPSFNDVFVIPFTVSLSPPQSTGASSILFLPGIMGSRLYEESDVCGNDVEVRERWTSFSDCDQLRLQTNYLGQSLNTIYTYAKESALVDEIGVAFGQGPNIYKTFLNDLKDWKEEGHIADYSVLPYDWRLRIDDLMKLSRDPLTNKVTLDSDVPLNESYLYETVSRLAQGSNNKKVLVVAHSNGGLVIKYFLQLLKESGDPLLERIDSVILVAVPQEGTPESIVGSLHGVDLGFGGIVMKSEVSRKLLKDSPFGFHLLPTEKYFDSVLTPVIQIEGGMNTNDWLAQFGKNISSYAGLQNFMTTESSRTKGADSDLVTPSVLNSYAFTYKSQLAEKLSDWEVPDGIKIYQIAGTGVSTPSGITYFTDTACIEKSFFDCIHYEKKLGYRINSVLDGDGTVVTPSALSISEGDGVERWWLDLDEYNNSEDTTRIHRDILEVKDIRDFVLAVAASSSEVTYNYLNTEPPEIDAGERLIFQLHSPLDMYAVLSDGYVVGSSTEVVRGAYYRRFGEVQQLSIPATEVNYVMYLNGQSSGSFSLDVEKYTGGSLNERFTYSAIPSSATTKVEFPVVSSDEISSSTSLVVDYDGDGVVDTEVAIWSYGDSLPEIISAKNITPEVVSDKSRSSSSGTRVGLPATLLSDTPTPLVAGITTSIKLTQIEIMQQIVVLLEQYRDLLIIINSRRV
jgi:hypothetical protein